MNYRLLLPILLLLLGACSSPESGKQTPEVKSTNEKKNVATKEEKQKSILFFGNSITAGYQLDMDQAFPALIQKRLDSLGLNYQSINAGLSGETSAGGKSRIGWVLKTIPDIFVLELGANDGLRGLPLDETIKNLQDIIDQVRKENSGVKVVVAGMMVPPNLGPDYSQEFQNVFKKIAKDND
ncbi:MAG: arylesterase, partial [Ekhidna sp.]|nr:arylesterase [Ekhidna sp.]